MAIPARPYTVPELAEHWQCSRAFIYKLVNEGALPIVPIPKFGKRRTVRIPRHVIETLDRGEPWPPAPEQPATEQAAQVQAERPQTRQDEREALRQFRMQQAIKRHFGKR